MTMNTGIGSIVGSDHFFCGTNYCDASYMCRAPCPSGYDAECPNGYRCMTNTPCNANILRTYLQEEEVWSGVLEYGLPTRAMDYYHQYYSTSLSGSIDWDNANVVSSTKYTVTRNVILGLFFGICILCLIIMNYMLYQRRMGGGGTRGNDCSNDHHHDRRWRRADDPWLDRDITVRILSKKLDGGQHYKRRGIVKRVISNEYADVELLESICGMRDGGRLLRIHQDDLERL